MPLGTSGEKALCIFASYHFRGNLPPNLHVQLDPLRFDPNSEGEFSVTAFPGQSTVMVTPEARKKYKDYVPEERHPWINSYGDLPKPWGPNSRLGA